MKIVSRCWGAIAGGLLGLVWLAPSQAQSALLTRAEVYKVVNQVQLLLSDRTPRAAKLADVLAPQDAIKTAARSRAELLFNEGSLARIGSNAIFRFIPGMRGFQLKNGTALIMSLPQQMATQIETPGGNIIAAAAPPGPDGQGGGAELYSIAMAISVDAADDKNVQVKVFSLTNAPIAVMDRQGKMINLQGGQFLVIRNGQAGLIQTFDLKAFYQSSALSVGLGPDQAAFILQEPSSVQPTLQTVRKATLAALDVQTRWLEGLCTLNSRGGASTLATNCITTHTDDPLRNYQDRREVTTPLREVGQPSRPIDPPIMLPSPQPSPSPSPGPTGTVILIQGGNNQNSNNSSIGPR